MIARQPSRITVEVIDDADYNRAARAIDEEFKKNSDWLALHWSDLLPQARGRFVAVADGESHIADSIEEAWAWVRTAHPAEQGALVQYVHRETLPRIYANRR